MSELLETPAEPAAPVEAEAPARRGRPFAAGDDPRRKSAIPHTEAEIIAAARVKAARRLFGLVSDRDDATALAAIRVLATWIDQTGGAEAAGIEMPEAIAEALAAHTRGECEITHMGAITKPAAARRPVWYGRDADGEFTVYERPDGTGAAFGRITPPPPIMGD